MGTMIGNIQLFSVVKRRTTGNQAAVHLTSSRTATKSICAHRAALKRNEVLIPTTSERHSDAHVCSASYRDMYLTLNCIVPPVIHCVDGLHGLLCTIHIRSSF